MSSAPCPRAWQAEAIEDGRLSRADAASFERHAAACSICSAEVRAFGRLRGAATRVPGVTSSPLEHRRQRQLLLRRAHELGLEPPRRTRRWLVASLAVLAVALAVFVSLGSRSGDRGAAPIATPHFELEASREARYRTLERSATLRLALELGRFEVAVHRLVGGQRFVLTLPDGELEVHGTRFVVEIEGGRTRRVNVSEGRVALRLNGRAPLSLGAGEQFTLEPPTAPREASSGAPENAQSPAKSVENPRPTGSAPRRSGATPGSAASSATGTAGSEFGFAMKAFGDGDYGRAEQLFIDFERKHPSDSRVEDANFLRAVARSRRGDGAGARRIASDYLARYPNGLRRLEAERLAH